MPELNIYKIRQLKGHQGAIYSMIPSRKEENTFYTGGGDGMIVKWKTNSENGTLIAKADGHISSLCFMEDENMMIAGDLAGGFHWMDLYGLKDVLNVMHHQHGVFDIIPFRKGVLSIGGGGVFTEWSHNPIKAVQSLGLTNTSLRSIVTTSDYIIIGASDNAIYYLNYDFEIVDIIEDAHDNSIFALAANENLLISGGRDAAIRIWNNDAKMLHEINAHWFTVNDIKINPVLPIFASASRDKTIRIWDLETYRLIKEINTIRDGGHTHSVNKIFWLDEETLVSASDDRTIIIWQIEIK